MHQISLEADFTRLWAQYLDLGKCGNLVEREFENAMVLDRGSLFMASLPRLPLPWISMVSVRTIFGQIAGQLDGAMKVIKGQGLKAWLR